MKKKIFLLILCLFMLVGCGTKEVDELEEVSKGLTNNTDQEALDIPTVALEKFDKLMETYGNHPTVIALLGTKKVNNENYYMYLVYDTEVDENAKEYKAWEVLSFKETIKGEIEFIDSALIYFDDYDGEADLTYSELDTRWKVYTKSGSGLQTSQIASFNMAMENDNDYTYSPIIILTTDEDKEITYQTLAYQTDKETNITNLCLIKYKEDGKGNTTLVTNSYFNLENY